jgi:hypothetical protein
VLCKIFFGNRIDLFEATCSITHLIGTSSNSFFWPALPDQGVLKKDSTVWLDGKRLAAPLTRIYWSCSCLKMSSEKSQFGKNSIYGIKWRYDTQHNDIQHNDIQHNDTQYNDTQHNDIQHNDIQHKRLKTNIQHYDTLPLC